MSMPTVAIIIGVSFYQENDIQDLPAAQVDAINFARAIRNWGILESDIHLFINSCADKKAIDVFFALLSERTEPYKFIFYFCGHGHRDGTANPKSYLFFHDSYLQDDRPINAISLDHLLYKISKLNALESYVIIDACYLRINTIRNPKLEEEINGKKISNKSLFCLLSSGILESFENEERLYGYFTEALLKSLCKIRNIECSPTHLLNFINKEMEVEGLPPPEAYNLGNQKITFLSNPELSLLHQGFVYRDQVITEIQDALIKNREKIVCLIGDSGVGKSAICQYIASDKVKTILIKIPHRANNDFDHIEYLIRCIKEQLSGSLEFDNIFQFAATHPYYLIILDQLERLCQSQLDVIIDFISKLKMKFLFVSSCSLKNIANKKFRSLLIDLEILPFSSEELEKFCKMIKPDCSTTECENAKLLSRGNPLKVRKILLGGTAYIKDQKHIEKELQSAISAICSCGYYLNEPLFAKTFNIEEKTLKLLESIGLISNSKDGWEPHEFLYDIVENEKLPIHQKTALSYWYHQVNELPGNPEAAQHLIRSVECFGFEEEGELPLIKAIQALSQKGKLYLKDLIKGAGIFLIMPKMSSASLFLAECLIELGEFEIAQRLLDIPSLDEFQSRVTLCKAQIFLRTGLLEKCIEICTHMLGQASHLELRLNYYSFRGMSYFLDGNWSRAIQDFTYIFENTSNKSSGARAQLMLGTILGFRGIDLEKGKEYLEEGTRLLINQNDLMGVWTGWNNLGEIFWKNEEYRSSAYYLDKAYDLAKTLNHESALLETLRNLLHLHLRMSGPFSTTVTELLDQISKLNWLSCEFFERVQIHNALAIAYIFRGDFSKAISLLKISMSMTSKYTEHRIYTLSNLSLLYSLLGKAEKSEFYFNKAIRLAKNTENHLAISQLKNDFKLYHYRLKSHLFG